jgi:hypothetical protein
MSVQRVRLDRHALKIQLAEQLLELRVLVALVGHVAALSNCQAQFRRVEGHLGNEGCSAVFFHLDGAAQRLAASQTNSPRSALPPRDLGQRPVNDRGADRVHIHLQEEVAKG